MLKSAGPWAPTQVCIAGRAALGNIGVAHILLTVTWSVKVWSAIAYFRFPFLHLSASPVFTSPGGLSSSPLFSPPEKCMTYLPGHFNIHSCHMMFPFIISRLFSLSWFLSSWEALHYDHVLLGHVNADSAKQDKLAESSQLSNRLPFDLTLILQRWQHVSSKDWVSTRVRRKKDISLALLGKLKFSWKSSRGERNIDKSQLKTTTLQVTGSELNWFYRSSGQHCMPLICNGLQDGTWICGETHVMERAPKVRNARALMPSLHLTPRQVWALLHKLSVPVSYL